MPTSLPSDHLSIAHRLARQREGGIFPCLDQELGRGRCQGRRSGLYLAVGLIASLPFEILAKFICDGAVVIIAICC